MKPQLLLKWRGWHDGKKADQRTGLLSTAHSHTQRSVARFKWRRRLDGAGQCLLAARSLKTDVESRPLLCSRSGTCQRYMNMSRNDSDSAVLTRHLFRCRCCWATACSNNWQPPQQPRYRHGCCYFFDSSRCFFRPWSRYKATSPFLHGSGVGSGLCPANHGPVPSWTAPFYSFKQQRRR